MSFPDAAQREAVRCRAGVHMQAVSLWVPALRSSAKNAAPRPGHETYFPIASATRPSVPTMTRHHANNVKPWRVT
jgi:hypothetical protein